MLVAGFVVSGVSGSDTALSAELFDSYFDLAIDDERGRIYGSHWNSGVVDVLDMSTFDVLHSVPVGPEPAGLDISEAGSELAVALHGGGEVAFVDLETLTVDARVVPDVTSGPNRPLDVLYGRPGLLYSVGSPGAHGLDHLHVIDTVTDTEIARSAEFVRSHPRLAMTADHDTLYVSEGSASPGQIYQYDISGDVPVRTAKAPHGPVSVSTLAVTPDGGQVFSSQGQVWSGDLETQSGSFEPYGHEIEYSAAHDRFFVTAAAKVVEFDAQTLSVVRIYRLSSLGGPARVSGDTLYVSTELGLETREVGAAATDLPIDSYGEFTALTPERVLDTRTGEGRGGVVGPLGENQSIGVQIEGRGGVAATGVSAVVLNVTVTEPTAPSHLTVWPSGAERPSVSNLNYVAGQTVPNLVTVATGDDGQVRVSNRFGSTHVVADVVGFYADDTGPPGSRYHSVDPYRYFDTRTGRGGIDVGPVGPDSVVRFQALGRGGVPTEGVTSVVMNVTVTGATEPSFLTVYPDDVSERPLASNLNFVAGRTIANLVTVRVPPSGVIDFYNLAGNVHVVADVVGYYDDDRSTHAGRFVRFLPFRPFDSRAASSGWGPDEWYGIGDFPGFGGLPLREVESVVLNVTATRPTAPSYLTVFPSDLCEVPLASSLNFDAGQTVPNHVIVRLATYDVCAPSSWVETISVYNRFGNVHVIIDAFGAFTSSTTTLFDY